MKYFNKAKKTTYNIIFSLLYFFQLSHSSKIQNKLDFLVYTSPKYGRIPFFCHWEIVWKLFSITSVSFSICIILFIYCNWLSVVNKKSSVFIDNFTLFKMFLMIFNQFCFLNKNNFSFTNTPKFWEGEWEIFKAWRNKHKIARSIGIIWKGNNPIPFFHEEREIRC